MTILGVVQGGVQEMLVQYLQLTLGFTTKDQGALFVVLGSCNLVVQIVVLPMLVPLLGERNLLILGLAVSVVEQGLLAVAAAKWQVRGGLCPRPVRLRPCGPAGPTLRLPRAFAGRSKTPALPSLNPNPAVPLKTGSAPLTPRRSPRSR